MNKNRETLKETFAKAFYSYKKNDFKNAEILCYKILSIDANHVDSISLLSTISAINKNFHQAKELMERALKIKPTNTSFLNNLATAHKELGNLKDAIKIYTKAIEIDPNHTNSNYNLGLAFYTLGELKNAKKYLQKTVDVQKNYALAFIMLGNVHVELKELKHGVSCFQKAIEINPKIASAHNNLGLIFRDLNDFKNASSCFKKAIEIEPNYANSHHNLALVYKELGEFEKSIQAHESAIKSENDNLMHYHFLSELKKDILTLQLKEKIEKILLNNKFGLSNIAYGNYLLAKYERKEKNYEKEFNYLTTAHQNFFNIRKNKFELNNKFCFDDVHQIMNGAKVEKLRDKSLVDIKPIFIMGVPRSGSTVVERIIGSGPKYIPIGEETGVISNFITNKILEKESLNLGNVEHIRNELFDIYKDKGLISKKYENIFTDKSLDNFFYLELINDIYPNAKIINCRRDILSSIMSIFQNNLTALAWTHDLDNIFKYFDNYFKIIENYKEKKPDMIYELEFEKLIKNPEEESKKLMKYCELPWDKKCLEFHKRKDLFSKTASNIQIRNAIYKHEPNKYLPYKKLLEKYKKNYSWFN